MAILLERLFKWLLLASLLLMAVAFFHKDDYPEPAFYEQHLLKPPRQVLTDATPFTTRIGDYTYEITPRFNYSLHGVVVSYHDADALDDIWHHRVWKDYLNLRDLCVIWGDNVPSRFYLDAAFSNDSWTCWTFWPDREVGARFRSDQLSNNHLISDDPHINELIMSAELGDQIKLSGMLAEYANKANGFHRGTSTVRTDTGNGACETIYVTEFEVIKKANAGWRKMYQATKLVAVLSLVGFIVMLFITPVRLRHA